MDGRQVTAVFPDSHRAAAARDRLIAAGAPAADMVVRDATVTKGVSWATYSWSCTWSIIGRAVGGGLGAAISLTIGTPGSIIQMVSWAIFAHLLIGLWAGYLRLADRSGREIGAGPLSY